ALPPARLCPHWCSRSPPFSPTPSIQAESSSNLPPQPNLPVERLRAPRANHQRSAQVSPVDIPPHPCHSPHTQTSALDPFPLPGLESTTPRNSRCQLLAAAQKILAPATDPHLEKPHAFASSRC